MLLAVGEFVCVKHQRRELLDVDFATRLPGNATRLYKELSLWDLRVYFFTSLRESLVFGLPGHKS